MRKEIISSILMGSLLIAPAAFAGNPGQGGQAGQAGQTGQAGQAGQQGQGGGGFFQSIKDSFKKGFQAGKKAAVKAGDAIQNKVMDTGVAVKEAITGKKDKTFVKGHYTKNGVHVKGHFRKLGGQGGK